MPPTTAILDSFVELNQDAISKLVKSARSVSCPLDPIPTFIVKDHLPVILPFITSMCNASLLEGHLPLSQRHAVIFPDLKKYNLDPGDVKSYRPISNLTFMSKLVERAALSQLLPFLDANKLLPSLQFAYRPNHSTETAVLKVLSDIFSACDRGELTLLGMLDLSAAFDTVDHDILLHRLSETYGIRGRALHWFASFVLGRSSNTSFADKSSSSSDIKCGVPQGSVLGPVLFILYTADVIEIARHWGFGVLSYADDSQLNFHAKPGNCSLQSARLSQCINDIERWLSANRLKMNPDKSQFIWFGTPQLVHSAVSRGLISTSCNGIDISDNVVDLGVTLDSNLTMRGQILKITQSSYYQLRQLRSIRRSLSLPVATGLVHAFVTSRVDYCNSALYGVAAVHLDLLQSVLHTAARLISRKLKYDHITPTLRDELHWLPVRQRIHFKLCTITFKALHGVAPAYISDSLLPVSSYGGRSHLRSAAKGDLVIPRTRTARFGPRSFAVACPTLWNGLPLTIRDPALSFEQFKSRLKTFLFQQAYFVEQL